MGTAPAVHTDSYQAGGREVTYSIYELSLQQAKSLNVEVLPLFARGTVSEVAARENPQRSNAWWNPLGEALTDIVQQAKTVLDRDAQ